MFGLFKNKEKTASVNKTIRKQEINGIPVAVGDGDSVVHLRFGNEQHIGSRDQQQDSFGYSNLQDESEIAAKGVMAVLADGMGGLSNGKQISEYVVSAMLTMFSKSQPANIPEQLKCMAEKINEEVCHNFSVGNQSHAGSTLAAIVLYKTKLYWICAGDSRIYVYRKGALYQLNEDHNYLNQLLTDHMRGDISLDKAKSDEQKGALTSYIGCADLPYLDFNKRGFAIQRGDIFLLCSDGVYNALNNADLIDCMQDEPQRSAHKIIKAVLSKRIKGQDNSTAMVIEYK